MEHSLLHGGGLQKGGGTLRYAEGRAQIVFGVFLILVP